VAHATITGSKPTKGNQHGQDDRRLAPSFGTLVFGFAVTAMLAIPVGSVGAVSKGSISPTTLTSSGQRFEVTYSGLRTGDQGSSLAVEECIADDRKTDFNPAVHCSSLSRQFFFGLPESGTVTYGGNPAANPIAPFVGLDPESGAWSVCSSESGVTNHENGYLRVSESPSDQTTDLFVPFTCASAGARRGAESGDTGASGVVVAAGVGVVAVGGIVGIARKRQRPRSSSLPR